MIKTVLTLCVHNVLIVSENIPNGFGSPIWKDGTRLIKSHSRGVHPDSEPNQELKQWGSGGKGSTELDTSRDWKRMRSSGIPR